MAKSQFDKDLEAQIESDVEHAHMMGFYQGILSGLVFSIIAFALSASL